MKKYLIIVPISISVIGHCKMYNLKYTSLRQYKIPFKQQQFILTERLAKQYKLEQYIKEEIKC